MPQGLSLTLPTKEGSSGAYLDGRSGTGYIDYKSGVYDLTGRSGVYHLQVGLVYFI